MATMKPTPNEIDAAFAQGMAAVHALFEAQAELIRDLEAKIAALEAQSAGDSQIHIRAISDQPAARVGEVRRVINQGDIYWVPIDAEGGAEPGIPHPHVVLQEDVFNHSRIGMVVACALTSNVQRASLPGNVLLEVGEANLPRQSVVEVSKVSSLEKAQLGEYIGSLTDERVSQILAGMRFLQRSLFAR
jgi:mRNA interferase MazF